MESSTAAFRRERPAHAVILDPAGLAERVEDGAGGCELVGEGVSVASEDEAGVGVPEEIADGMDGEPGAEGVGRISVIAPTTPWKNPA